MKVKLYIRVCSSWIGTSPNDARVFREIDLPFAPFEGLFLVFPNGEEFEVPRKDDPTWVYGGLSYDVQDETFSVMTYHRPPVSMSLDKNHIEEAVNNFVESGWKIR